MRTFRCSCSETLFFDNTQCVNCGGEVGFCPICRNVVSLVGNGIGGYVCGNPGCGAALLKCHNYHAEKVCNHCIAASAPGGTLAEALCECCRYNETIPDLTKQENREKWRRLESAKRRVFYQLILLGLPKGNASEGFAPPLSFEFKEETVVTGGVTGILSDQEVVMTGHVNGKITINIREADPVERERLRIQFAEPHRSLIGHFRHEMAHYYWDLLIKGKQEDQSKAVFGDHDNPPYADALQRYYKYGPAADWDQRHASAYASMHPWEDFAETFTAYLEMVGTLDTAFHTGLGGPGIYEDFDQMITAYPKLGVALNEINRAMGLKDVLARPLAGPVIEKMRFIHQLVQNARAHP